MAFASTLLLGLAAHSGCAKGKKDLGESCRGNVDAKDNTDCKKGLVCGYSTADLSDCRTVSGQQLCRADYKCSPCDPGAERDFPTCRAAGASRSPLGVIE